MSKCFFIFEGSRHSFKFGSSKVKLLKRLIFGHFIQQPKTPIGSKGPITCISDFLPDCLPKVMFEVLSRIKLI